MKLSAMKATKRAPRPGWSSLPTGLSSGWQCAALGPKCKISIPVSFVPKLRMSSFADLDPAVLEPQCFENVDTPPTDGRTFDRFYTSSLERWLYTRKLKIQNFHSCLRVLLTLDGAKATSERYWPGGSVHMACQHEPLYAAACCVSQTCKTCVISKKMGNFDAP